MNHYNLQKEAFCLMCGEAIGERKSRGNIAKYCNNACRQKYHRLIKKTNLSIQENINLRYKHTDLKTDRAELGYTKEEFCIFLGIPEKLYLQYEEGTVGIPKLVALAVKGKFFIRSHQDDDLRLKFID